MESKSGRPLKIYISYSNKDKAYRDKLLNHLQGLVKNGQIDIWSDHLLVAGDEFMKTFNRELANMDIWVVLISPDSMNSGFIWDIEHKAAIERGVHIVPILLRPTMWEGTQIEKYNIIPTFAKAISTWGNEDEAFLDVASNISKMIASKEKKINHVHFNAPAVIPTPQAAASVSTKKGRTKSNALTNIKIFLASSSELLADRDQFEIFINRENKNLVKKGMFLELVRWEDFLDTISVTRLQDEYNQVLSDCDFVVCLFYTKVGKYTAEEFDTALGQFRRTGKPQILTYFKDAPVKPSEMRAFNTLLEFKDKLDKLGHFPNHYESLGDLKHHFGEQLKKLGIS